MAEEQEPTTDLDVSAGPAADGDRPGWRTGVLPAWVLVLGLVVLVVAGLGLASIGHPVGILAVAVLEAAVVALFYSWVSSTGPR